MSNHDQKSVISEFDSIIDFSAHSKTLEFFVELIFENISKSIMERKLSLNSLFTLPLKSPLPLSSHTIRFWQLTRLWNILIVHSWLITKPFTIFAKRIWVLNALVTEIWIGWLVKLFLQSPLRYASMELSMSIWMNSKLTWFHIQESISLLPPTLPSSLLIEPSTSNWA